MLNCYISGNDFGNNYRLGEEKGIAKKNNIGNFKSIMCSSLLILRCYWPWVIIIPYSRNISRAPIFEDFEVNLENFILDFLAASYS